MLISMFAASSPFFTWLIISHSIQKSSLYRCCFLPYTILLKVFSMTVKIPAKFLLLGTALPGFRGCNPPWLRLSQSWDHKPLRRQSLSPWQKCHLCPLLPAWPWDWPVSQWQVRILKGGSTSDRLWSPGISSQGRTRGAVAKGGDGPFWNKGFEIAGVLFLSARSLLISWLLYFPCLT